MIYISFLDYNNVNIYIVAMGEVITEIGFGELSTRDIPESDLTIECKRQLEEYLNGTRKEFDIPYYFKSTEFHEKVWDALTSIPYGETISYKQLAEMIGSPNAVRAVGNACNSNMLPFLIPCHRVISANGKLSGYKGGLELKKTLLEIEGSLK